MSNKKNMKTKKASAPVHTVKKSVASNRMGIFSVALILLVLAIMTVKNSASDVDGFFYLYIRPAVMAVSALLAIGAITLWVYRCKNGITESAKSLPASLVFIISAGVFAVCLAYRLSATRILVSLLAVSALYFIYYLYPRSFFVYSAVTLTGGLMLAFFRFGGVLGFILPLIVLLALLAAVIMMLVGGSNPFGGLLSAKKEDRYPVVVTAAILLAGLVIGLFAPSLLFYALALLFASFLVIAIMKTLQML